MTCALSCSSRFISKMNNCNRLFRSTNLFKVTKQKQERPLLFSFIRSSRRQFSTDIKIVEVGPRDGLQNEILINPDDGKLILSSNDKVTFINKLMNAGCTNIEIGSIVSPKWVPSMADSMNVLQLLNNNNNHNDNNDTTTTTTMNNSAAAADNNINFSCLVPNKKGVETLYKFVEENNNNTRLPQEIAVFISASESFSKRNINCTIDESLQRVNEIIQFIHNQTSANNNNSEKVKVRGYISCVLGCPYEGISNNNETPKVVAKLVDQLLSFGCYEISLGDTIGVGTPASTNTLLSELSWCINDNSSSNDDDYGNLAVHFHDTYGQALANIYTSITNHNIKIIDSSVAGLGGCPYAGKGASGNVATEDVIYMLNGMGLTTGIDLMKLIDAGEYICSKLNNRQTQSKVGKAILLSSSKDR